jgi:hypothetical protein
VFPEDNQLFQDERDAPTEKLDPDDVTFATCQTHVEGSSTHQITAINAVSKILLKGELRQHHHEYYTRSGGRLQNCTSLRFNTIMTRVLVTANTTEL